MIPSARGGAFLASPAERADTLPCNKLVYFKPRTMRLSLVEASQGRIGETLDRVLLWCFHYDSQAGQYTLATLQLGRATALLTLIGLAVFVGTLKRQQRRRAVRAQSIGST